jgi:tripartite-type tricarboxylate transporter receptor subunit TctC
MQQPRPRALTRRLVTALLVPLAGATFATGAGVATAQDYPSRPLKMIVPFAPGGATDISARLIAPKLAEALGQQVVVENRAGAGGIIGMDATAKSPADGYTMVMATNGEFVMNPSIYPKLPYDPSRDLQMVSVVFDIPLLLVVPPSSPYGSLGEILAAAKAKPGTLAYSTAGIGSTSHVLTELLAAESGVRLLHVPYKGGAPASAAVATGEVAMTMISLGAALPFVRGGKAKAIAHTRAARHPSFPEWPTIAESGVPGFTEGIWVGLAVPAGTPPAAVARLSAEAAKAARSPELRERLVALGTEPIGSTADEATARVRREVPRFATVIKQAGIKAE